MRRFLGYLVAVLLVVVIGASGAVADTFFLYDQYGGTWQDANKSVANTEDDLMCWAAAASNILAWGHWETDTYNTTDLIFQHFQDHWTDAGGWMNWGWKWWFDGSPPPTSAYSYPDVPGGGNFYPTVNFNDYYASSTGGNLMSAIDTLLHQGKGVTLGLLKNGGSHAVTIWGYTYSTPGTYTSLYLTDADDGYLGLREYPLIWQDDAWYLGGGYSGWQIITVQALGSSPAPIPPSWLLFGTGVFSLFLLGRRRRLQKGNP